MSSNPPSASSPPGSLGKTGGKSILLMQQRLLANANKSSSSNLNSSNANADANDETNGAKTNDSSSGFAAASSTPSTDVPTMGRPTGKSAAHLMRAQERIKQQDSNPSSNPSNHPTSVVPVQVNRNAKPKGKDFSAMAKSQSQSNNSGSSTYGSAPKPPIPSLPPMDTALAPSTSAPNPAPVVPASRSTGKGKDFAAMLNKTATSAPNPAQTNNISNNANAQHSSAANPNVQLPRNATNNTNISSNIGAMQAPYQNVSQQDQQPLSSSSNHSSANTNSAPTSKTAPVNNVNNTAATGAMKPTPLPKPGGRAALIREAARAQMLKKPERKISGGLKSEVASKQQVQSQLQQTDPNRIKQQQSVNKSNPLISTVSSSFINDSSASQGAPLPSPRNAPNSDVKSSSQKAPTPPSLPPPKPTPKPTIAHSKLSTKPTTSISQNSQNTYGITGIKLQSLLSSISPNYTLDSDAQDQILQLADDFLDKLVSQSMKFAKHRDSKNVDVKDIKLALKKQWGMNVEGFGLGNDGKSSNVDSNGANDTENKSEGKVALGGKTGRGIKRNISDVVA